MMQVFRRALSSAVIVVPACLIFAGCGGSGSDAAVVGQLVPVTGKVLFKGEPLFKGAVMFNPVAGTPGTGGFGVTDEQGEYKLVHRNQEEGIEPGSYRVVITRMAMKDGGPIPEGKSAADVEAVQIIPAPFSDANSEYPGTAVTVPAAGGTFSFEIPAQ